jgi:hypothetical protein
LQELKDSKDCANLGYLLVWRYLLRGSSSEWPRQIRRSRKSLGVLLNDTEMVVFFASLFRLQFKNECIFGKGDGALVTLYRRENLSP